MVLYALGTSIQRDMKTKRNFKTKEDPELTVSFSMEDIKEIVPDADMRFSLVILTNGDKHFVCGSEPEIREAFAA